MNFALVILVIGFALNSVKISRCDNNDAYRISSSDNESTERNRNSMLCMDIKPQHSVNIDHILGMWYGSEIIVHSQDVPGTFRYNSCVIIHLSDVTEQMRTTVRDHNYNNYRRTYATTNPIQQQQHNTDPISATKYLRLIWTEANDNLEYTFNYTEHSPGLWTNVIEQRGSLVTLNQYTQFTGSVQVVKAVHDHVVLTFCGNEVKSSIYTIVLTRNEKGLSSEVLRTIRNLLSRRGLSTETIRQVCKASASSQVQSVPTVLMVIFLALCGVFKKILD